MKSVTILLMGLSALALASCGASEASPKAQVQTDKVAAATPAEAPKVTTTDLGNGLYMLEGKGGNVGVAIGPNKIAVIDDQYAVMSKALIGAIRVISDKPIAYMINTHYHGDHALKKLS